MSFYSLLLNFIIIVLGILKSVGDVSVEILEFKLGSVIVVFKLIVLLFEEIGLKNRFIVEMRYGKLGVFVVELVFYLGRVFDVIFKLNIVCNDLVVDKGFV